MPVWTHTVKLTPLIAYPSDTFGIHGMLFRLTIGGFPLVRLTNCVSNLVDLYEYDVGDRGGKGFMEYFQ